MTASDAGDVPSDHATPPVAIDAVLEEQPPRGAGAQKAPRRALGVALAVGGVGLALDQGTKMLATVQLPLGVRIPIVGDLLGLTLVYNPGAAFSMGSGSTWILTLLAAAAVAAILVFAVRLRGARWGIALGLILGGAGGNLVDRLANPPSFGNGHVTDFLAYGNLFVGNVADVLLVVGVAFLCSVLLASSRRTEEVQAGE